MTVGTRCGIRSAAAGARRAGVVAAVLAVPLLLAAACASSGNSGGEAGSSGGAAGSTGVAADLQAHDWVLDNDDSSVTIAHGHIPTMTVMADSVSGTAPCNTYGATLALDGTSIKLTAVRSTLMSCGDDIDAEESAFLAALKNVTTVSTAETDRMVLTGADKVRLAFKTYDASTAIVGEWKVTSVANGDAVSSVITGTDPVLTVKANGDLSLYAGCNTIGSTWTLDGHALTVAPVRSTLMACTDPAGVMEQEAALGKALEAARTVQITPDSLILLDANDHITLVATKG